MKHHLQKEDSLLLQIDLQESLVNAMANREELIKNGKILSQAAEIMGLRTLFTSQYKKGLGPVMEEIRQLRSEADDFDKKTFSCVLDEDIKRALEKIAPKNIIVSGIEAHICLLLTVRDLIGEGYTVYVAFDATASRKEENKMYALEEMRDMGAIIRSTESILFDLNSVSGTEEFKAVQKLIK